jgi:hypothetical protein
MPEFNSIFPHFTGRCVELRNLLLPITYLLFIGGIISTVITNHRSGHAFLRTFGKTIVYIILLTFLVNWGNTLSRSVDTTVKEVMKVDPTKIQDQYNAALELRKSSEEQKSWWEKIFEWKASIFEGLLSVFFYFLGWVASAIVFYAYIIQKVIIYLGYGLAPLFIGFLAFGTLSGIGTRYLLHLLGVLLWPLGWGVAGLVTEGLIDFMTDRSFLHGPFMTTDSYTLQNFIGIGALGIWIIFSTIAAPVLIQRAIAEGFLIGSALMSGAATAGRAALSAGMTTGATVAANAIGPNGVNGGLLLAGLGAGAAAGAESLAGSSSGMSDSSMVNSLTHLRPMAYRGSQSDDAKEGFASFPLEDITGDKTVAELLRQTKNPHSQG